MKLHFLLAAAAALLCAAPIVAASGDNAIMFKGVESDNSILVGVARRESSPTRRPRRTSAPTRRPPSAQRREARDRERIVRRNRWTEDQCTGESLSEVCQDLNRLVCSSRRRELESRERRTCELVGLGRRRSEDEEFVDYDEDEEEYENDFMDSEDEGDVVMEEE